MNEIGPILTVLKKYFLKNMADVFQTRAGIHGCYRCPLIAPRHSNESYAGKQIDKNKQKFQI